MKTVWVKILPLVVVTLLIADGYGCGASHPAISGYGIEMQPGYEITIRCVDNSNPVGKLIQVFSERGIIVTGMQQRQMSFDRYELVFNVRYCNSRQLGEAEHQLRGVLNVESMVVRRL